MKKIISLAMCLILLLSLCACGKSKQAKAVEEQMLLASRVFFRSPPLFLTVSGFCFPQLCAFIIAKLLCYKWHRS